MKKLGFLGLIALTPLVLTSCGKDSAKLTDTLYRSENVRITCADGTNKNHTANTYKLELYSDNTYVMTYTQTNAVTMLDLTYGRVITSYGIYSVESNENETSTYNLQDPTRVTLAAFSRNNVHTYADTSSWNNGNEAEGIPQGVSYKLYDYGSLEVYETVEQFMAVYAKKYSVKANTNTKNMTEVVVVGSTQVEIPLIGM